VFRCERGEEGREDEKGVKREDKYIKRETLNKALTWKWPLLLMAAGEIVEGAVNVSEGDNAAKRSSGDATDRHASSRKNIPIAVRIHEYS
jgi:hypothetical protein